MARGTQYPRLGWSAGRTQSPPGVGIARPGGGEPSGARRGHRPKTYRLDIPLEELKVFVWCETLAICTGLHGTPHGETDPMRLHAWVLFP